MRVRGRINGVCWMKAILRNRLAVLSLLSFSKFLLDLSLSKLTRHYQNARFRVSIDSVQTASDVIRGVSLVQVQGLTQPL